MPRGTWGIAGRSPRRPPRRQGGCCACELCRPPLPLGAGRSPAARGWAGGKSRIYGAFPGELKNRGAFSFERFCGSGFNLDPADPSAQGIWEAAPGSAGKASREPTKAHHQRCLVCAGNRIEGRLNDPERMFHLGRLHFPAWLRISNSWLCWGPVCSPEDQSTMRLLLSRTGLPGCVARRCPARWVTGCANSIANSPRPPAPPLCECAQGTWQRWAAWQGARTKPG